MKDSFTVYPAIDLRQGKVVRLQQGDPLRQTEYSRDPAATARRWLAAGARWLHVVNLDGAFGEQDQANQQALQAILAESARWGASVQFGGGLRSLEAVRQALRLGVSRAVLGTALVEQPALLASALGEFGPEAVAAGLDAHQGLVRVRGWQEGTQIRAIDLAERLAEHGLRWLIFTDVSRDGVSKGLNLPATLSLAALPGLQVIASGGVREAADVRRAREASLAGVIAGRALYEGTLRLEEVC